DLTSATNRDELPLMGVTGKETTIARNDGVQSYGNIVQLVESTKTAGVLYAGTDDGKVHMTRDGGKTWTDITNRFKGVPANAYVSRLTAGAHDVNVVYATFDNHRADDYGTFIYASVDGGNNFRSIGEGIPKGHTITAMAEDPKNPSVLYSGSEFGLFVSPDRGGRWMRIKSNLPTVPIHEIVIHPRDNDMIVATHGRSIWILDDMTPLQQYAEAQKTEAFLFDMRDAMQFNQANDRGFVSDKPFFGKNPTYGAPISYYLSKPQTNVALRIRDAQGTQVREITGNDLRDARGAGINRVYWDLRHQPLTPLAGQPQGGGGGGGGGFGGGGNNGPNVMAGDYRVTLVVDGKDVATKTVRVSGDKDMPMTDAERKTWHDTALHLHDLQRLANTAAETVNTLATQLTATESLVKSASNAPGSAKSALADANTKLADLRRRLGLNPQQGGGGGGGGGFGGQQQNVRGQLGQVKGQLMGSTSMPTAQQVRVAGELREDMTKVIADVNELINAIPAIYDALGASGVKPVALKPLGPLPAAR
ncbi:MAG: WD40/YVTN/BNR-like repeat-containing protein, partial [Vicinamibacterales bacterium]